MRETRIPIFKFFRAKFLFLVSPRPSNLDRSPLGVLQRNPVTNDDMLGGCQTPQRRSGWWHRARPAWLQGPGKSPVARTGLPRVVMQPPRRMFAHTWLADETAAWRRAISAWGSAVPPIPDRETEHRHGEGGRCGRLPYFGAASPGARGERVAPAPASG